MTLTHSLPLPALPLPALPLPGRSGIGRYLLGVDGGGTSCRVRLTDAAGAVLGQGLAGPCNIRLGAAVSWGEIRRACADAYAAAGLPLSAQAETIAVMGLAGAAQKADLDPFLAVPHPFALLDVIGDARTACLGAFGGEDGAILIVGTGSAGYGRVGEQDLSIGGWGFEISDHGSGAWIGRQAIERAVLIWDGLDPDGLTLSTTPLARAVLDPFGGTPFGVVAAVGSARPADFAALMPLVLDAAAANDPLATRLLDTAAAHLNRALLRLRALGAPRLSLVGGLAAALAPHLPAPTRTLLSAARGDALDGALIRAAEHLSAANAAVSPPS